MKRYTDAQIKRVQTMIKRGSSYSEVSKKLDIPAGTIPYLNKKSPRAQTAKIEVKTTNSVNVWKVIAQELRRYL